MLKKLTAAVMAASMVLSLAVIPAHAEASYNTGTFSSANWAQYERGFYTNTSNFTENMKVYTTDSSGDSELTSVRMVASTSNKITSTKNPVAYKYGGSSSDYGVHASDDATYAHMRLYLASFSDENHDMFKNFTMRIDKDGTGSSRDFAVFETYQNNGAYVTETYANYYKNAQSYISKTLINGHQGRLGNGPNGSTAAADCDSKTRVLSDSDYDKLDIIAEYNKQSGATIYLFVNGRFACCYYDSGLTDKHFHGIVFRTLANKTPRNNSDYIAVKMDTDRIGHREYYNTSDYMVTFEDVMQDAGLGDEVSNSKVMFKTSNVKDFMPGNEDVPYFYRKDDSARVRFNENVTYSGNTATITVTNEDTENYAVAANMLAGMYPIIGKMGVSYENYHPRARFIKISFDQTISSDGMWLEYATYYSGAKRALQMWNNDGSLVVGIKGGSNVTCNGNGGKPLATTTGTNHIDWIIDPEENAGGNMQYVYVNGTFAGSGRYGDSAYTARINDIVLSTKNKAGTVTIDNWSMTVYNGTMDYSDFEADFEATKGNNIYWLAGNAEIGVERGYTTSYEDMNDYFALYVTAKDTGRSVIPSGTKLYTAIYDGDYNLLDISETPYVSGQTVMDETEGKLFLRRYDGVKPTKAKIFVWTDGEPQGVLKSCTIDPDNNTLE